VRAVNKEYLIGERRRCDIYYIIQFLGVGLSALTNQRHSI